MNFRERTETNEQQAVGQGDAVSQVDEKLPEADKPGTSLFALCWLGIAAIAMVGWICALGWLAWRLADWLLS
ncbi:RNA-binding protein [Bradyrhizobium ganzhouense]|uniref:RNA-binding protein n=1 Tax=Bradyrhizobium ganzhouense TaxID=1179767 RepID=UPI003CF76C9F